MSGVFADLGVSLDGFVAGPNAGPGNALGDGGSRIQRWQYEVAAWQERLGESACGRNLDNYIALEKFERAGAYVMGRRMFNEGEVGWPDPPPFRAPVFVLTHRALVDQLQLHIAPVLLGDGVRLFDGGDAGKCKLELRESPSRLMSRTSGTESSGRRPNRPALNESFNSIREESGSSRRRT
jgi:dihydrofolate reductase